MTNAEMSDIFDSLDLEALTELCWQTHELALSYWKRGVDIEIKSDDSPVTKADKECNALIVNRLRELTPHISTISEEGDKPVMQANATYWLIDPIDGTKSFIRGENQFTVNIGLIHRQQAIFGLLGVPAQGLLYYGQVGRGVFRRSQSDACWQKITPQLSEQSAKRILTSKSHKSPKLDAWLAENMIEVAERIGANSALKFAMLAEGTGDLYARIGPTMEWDTAAGHAMINALGGELTRLDGSPFLYGKKDYLNPGFYARLN